MKIKIHIYDTGLGFEIKEYDLKHCILTYYNDWLLKSGLSGYGNYYFSIGGGGKVYIKDDIGNIVDAPKTFKIKRVDVVAEVIN